ncbi:MAG: hypothetical protein P0Y53_22580 [Candidatus Pseudobacter hemicellulosilyticus]|uniref:Zinc-finger domain-containing protein n=1 Tax=Candidatus Pseudobacter hemicellulosilyticus TaxID=3121375 RepID=A0AAJ6BGH7_9BACT|nr:MAG: hypothetical protein P0Y53_22580 [Pseudobacter sp.]
MDSQLPIEARLWEYIDGHSAATERAAIEQLLATNSSWQQKYQELLDLHQLMQEHIELEQPGLRFSKSVMESIAFNQITPAARTYINKRVIWGVATFFLLSILGFLVYGLAQLQWSSGNASDPSKLTHVIDKLESTDLALPSSYLYALMLVIVVMGLMLLDMVLRNKKKEKTV